MRMMRYFYSNSLRRNPIAGAASISDVVNNYTNVKGIPACCAAAPGTYIALFVRVAFRDWYNPTALTSFNFGFRCARTVTP